MFNKIIGTMAVLCLISFTKVRAQTYTTPAYANLKIGDTVPDIMFRNTVNFSPAVKKLSDLKGKLIILDFWATWCGSCLSSFPKIEALQKQFVEEIQVILVNPYETTDEIKENMQVLKKVNSKAIIPALPMINGDTIWKTIFPHSTVPHHVWIDQYGKVLSITDSYSATTEHIQKILNGETVVMPEKKNLVGYNIREKGLIKQGDDRLPPPDFYSAFMPFYNGIGSGAYTIEDSASGTLRITQRNRSVLQLFNNAANGYNAKETFLETKDSASIIKANYENDQWRQNNLYTYEICVPIMEKNNARKYMFSDLNRYFGMKRNIEGVIVTRKYPAWVLTISDSSLLHSNINTIPTKDIKTVKQGDQNIFTNMPFIALQSQCEGNLQDLKHMGIGFVDETGIKPEQRFNFTLPVKIKNNVPALQSALNKMGLNLKQEERAIKVLVLKDKDAQGK